MIELHATLEIRQLHACAVREEAGGPEGVLTTGHGRAQNRGTSTLPMRLLLVVVFSGLFLALAVAARGGIGAFFSQPALIGLTVVLIALGAAALVAGGNLSPGVREDTSDRWVIAVFCGPGAAGGRSGSSPATGSAGWVWRCSLRAAPCAFGRSSCWATGSADWWQFSPGTGWSR